MALVQDVARAGLLLRALLASVMQTGSLDLEVIGKASTLIGARRQGLLALGLDRVQSDALDLREYIARRSAQAPAGSANSAGQATEATSS